MLHRNGKEIEQLFRNGLEIALLYKNGVIIYDKRGNIQPSTQYTITYVNGESNNSDSAHIRTITVPVTETITTDSYTIPNTGQFNWDEHTFLGYSETQYPTYSNVATTVYAPGTEITVNHNMTLYPVWSTTFQGLINEGYVDMTKDPSGLSDYTYIGVHPNHYPKELVTDFMDVFTNQKGVTVSVNKGVITNTGTVAVDGTTCAFAFWRDTQLNNHWLTTDEWYNLFNERLFSTWPISSQFRYIDWSDKSSIHIKFVGQTGSTGWNCPQYLFGPTSPTVVTYELTNGYFGQTTQYLFGSSEIGCSSETINIVTSRPNAQNTPSSLNATFAGCRNLKTITGLNVSNSNGFPWAFDGCYAIETIPTLGASTWNMGTSTIQTFAHCYALETVTPILNVSNVTETKNTFTQCYELTNLQLSGINANKNKSSAYPNESYWVWKYDWDFTNTKLSQASANYIVTNLTEVDTTVSGFTYKTIGFPGTITLSEAQLIRLHDNGWNTYIGGILVDLSEKTLTYSANGGTNPPAAQTFVLSTTVTSSVPTTPEDAESFLGWSDIPNAITATYTAGDVITSTMTLYAVWQYSGFRDTAAVGVSSVGSQSYLETEINFDTLVNYLSLQDLCKIKYRRSISDEEMTTLSFRVNRVDTTNKIIEGSFISPDSGGMTINEITIGSKSTTKLTLDNNSFVNKTGYDLIIFKVITG